MNSTFIKLYGFFAGVALLAFLMVAEPARAIETTAALEPRSQERAINLAANMTNRFEATLERLENILTRIKSNQLRKEGGGFDLTPVTTKLQSASDLLTKSKISLRTIDQEVYEAMTANDPVAKWLLVKNKYQTIALDIPLIRQNIIESIIILGEAGDWWLKNQTSSSTAASSTSSTRKATTSPNATI